MNSPHDPSTRDPASGHTNSSDAVYGDARAVLRFSPLPILTMDLARRVTFWNEAAERLFGWTAEEILGQPLPIVPPEGENEFYAFWSDIAERKTFSGYETIRVARSGRRIPVSIFAGPLLGNDGQIHGVFAFLEDITLRKQRQESLAQNQAFLKMAAELSRVGAWSVDLPSMRHAWTDEARRIHGVAPGEQPSVDELISFYVGKDRDRIRTAFEACVRKGTPFDLRAEFVAADGTRKWVRSCGEAVHDGGDTIIRVQGAIQDVTDSVLSDKALLESEERYRALFENSHTVMLLIDAETSEIVHANRAAATFYGWSVEELAGKPIHEINILSEEEVRAEIHRASQRERNEFQFRHRLRSGEIRDVEVFAGPIEREGRRLLYTLVHDVTEKRRIENQLRLQSAALNAAANSIVITDADGVIEWANNSFFTLSGYDREETEGKRPGDLVKSGMQPLSFYEDMWAAITAGQVWSGEVVNRRKDGTTYTEELTITPMTDENGDVTHFVGVKQDVSERKRLEKQFLRAQRVESIGILAGGVAHDLNNVLTPIMLAIDALRTGEADSRKRAILDSMEASARRGSNLVRQVLDFSRGGVNAPSELNMKHVVRDMLQIMAETFPPGIEVVSELPSRLWTITADPTQMHQVLMNLCINARDAMPRGGRLQISLQNERLTSHFTRGDIKAHSGPHVRLAVKDTGTGITRDMIDRIFDPFFTSKEPGEGTGLGLSTVQSIVRAHGGFVDVASRPGQGAEFRVYLPAASDNEHAADREQKTEHEGPAQDEHQPVAPQNQVSPDTPARRTILIIDDEPAIRMIAAAALQHAGYDTLEAENGEQALEIHENNRDTIDAVLLDFAMPVMDGLATLNALRETGAKVPVILSSGHLSEAAEHELRQAGAQAVLPKPYAMAELAATLDRVLKTGTSSSALRSHNA